MADLIEKLDSLNDGREKINKSIEASERAEQKSDQSVFASDEAKGIAETAENKADSVQIQFDQVVIDGDSSVEAAQARVDAVGNAFPTLKRRLDDKEEAAETKLVQTQTYLPLGKLELPADFPKLPFNIYKKGQGRYTSDFEAGKILNLINKIDVFVASYGSNTAGSGDNPNNPITLHRLRVLIESGFYTQSTIVANFLESVYSKPLTLGRFSIGTLNKSVHFKSASPTGFTWVAGVFKTNDTSVCPNGWEVYNSIYKANLVSNTFGLIDVVNFNSVDDFGMPLPYQRVDSISECESSKGSFYAVSDTEVYCNPHETDDIYDVDVAFNQNMIHISSLTSINKIVFENIGFTHGCSLFQASSLNSSFFFKKSKFYRGIDNAFAPRGVYKDYLIDCVSAYANKDGYNYKSTNIDSLAVEVNCISYGNGQFKMPEGDGENISNNGSTAHEGMNMLRVGSKYWNCEGAIVADVNNCKTISIGCEVSTILNTAHPITKKVGFYFDNSVSTYMRPVSNIAYKYVIECVVSGKEIDYSVDGNSGIEYTNVASEYPIGNANQLNWNEVV